MLKNDPYLSRFSREFGNGTKTMDTKITSVAFGVRIFQIFEKV